MVGTRSPDPVRHQRSASADVTHDSPLIPIGIGGLSPLPIHMKEEAMPQELNPNVQFRNLVHDMSDVVDEAILNMLDSHHPDDKVLASLAEARGNVVRMNHALKIVTISITNDHPRVYADELPEGAKPKPLPLPK